MSSRQPKPAFLPFLGDHRSSFWRLLRQLRTPSTLGELGERAAATHLRRSGLRIVTTRRRNRFGEIDIVALDGETVVFVEVKTRRNESLARPIDAVDQRRQDRLVRASLAFLKSHRLLDYPSRYDVVEVLWPKGDKRPQVRHHANAFQSRLQGQMHA
ncbi:MAG: YraN family protein [Planctomycetota bacterium]